MKKKSRCATPSFVVSPFCDAVNAELNAIMATSNDALLVLEGEVAEHIAIRLGEPVCVVIAALKHIVVGCGEEEVVPLMPLDHLSPKERPR